jgi:hypothetical protein
MYLHGEDDTFEKMVDNYAKLKDIGPDKEITLKCYGLPLSITSTPRGENMLDKDTIDVIVSAKKVQHPAQETTTIVDTEEPEEGIEEVSVIPPVLYISNLLLTPVCR